MSIELSQVKVTRNRLCQQVTHLLQEMILSGELQAGDQLPAERQMAEQMGVSRTVVREAVKTLEQMGLVRVLTGSGTYVSRIEPEAISQSIGMLIQQSIPSFEHLTEIRRMLETETAALAAERAGAEHIAALEQALERMRDAAALEEGHPGRIERFIESDLAFHNVLVEAAGNPLLPILLRPVSQHLLEFRRLTFSVPGGVQSSVDYHAKILDEVKARDAVASRRAMTEHLKYAQKALEQVKAQGLG